MRILLDENLDWRLRRELPAHSVDSVPLIGWAGVKNSELLKRADAEYDVLITMDASLSLQHDPAQYRITVILLKAPSNRLADTRPLMTKVQALLPNLRPGTLTIVPE